MKQLKVFIVKFFIIGVVTFSILGIYFNATMGRLILMTLVVTGITYIGDLFILPKINQALAVVGDFIGFFVLYWALGNLVVEAASSVLLAALAAAYFATLAEAFFHIYVMDQLHEPDRAEPAPIPVRYQTEFSEESDAESAVEEKNQGENESTNSNE